jgi:hypothetical protein
MEGKLKDGHAGNAGVGHSVYSSRNGNGSNGANAPNGRGRVVTPAVSDLPRAADNQAHAQSSRNNGNGSQPFKEPATGSVIGVVRKPYDRLPHDPSEDDRLGPVALGILSYVFSRPPTWDISAKQLQQRFDGHRRLIRKALKQLQQAGWMALAQLRSADGTRACGRMWFARRSLDEPWPESFMTKDLNLLRVRILKPGNSLKDHKRDFQLPVSLNNTDKKPPLRKNDHAHAQARGKRKVSASSHTDSFLGFEDYQYQDKLAAQNKAHIAQSLQRNWGEHPLAAHPKWPEFSTWCRRQRGKPTEKGFWTWLAGQPRYWRDKIKPPDEIPGYSLDGKFYDAAAAAELFASDPDKYLDRFRPAVKRNGKVELVSNPPGNQAVEPNTNL